MDTEDEVCVAQLHDVMEDTSLTSNDIRAIESQIEAVKKLKELLDAGILTQEESDAKKRQIMGL